MSNRHFRINPATGICYRANDLASGWFYGHGVFTTFRLDAGCLIYRLESHFNRLKRDCEFFHIPFPWGSFMQFSHALAEFLSKTQVQPSIVVRVTIVSAASSGENPALDRAKSTSSEVFVTLRPALKRNPPVQACLLQFDRLFPQQKHMNHLAEVVYLRQARAKGFQDYLRVSREGYLTEAAYANLFLLDERGCLLTPDTERAGCLPGIMREAVLAACDQSGISVNQGCYLPEVLENCKGAFLCNAVRGLIPVSRVEHVPYSPSAIQPLIEQITRCLDYSPYRISPSS